ncbi:MULTISPECIES: hypothetical protein [unclassified Serratia (in: enterobacteria)]|uniref:hypothetical protein n=1 Tax=unclassified Serratia (in: enterobacteria) TaxID=2647522 RepID=UPI0030766C7F
MSKLLGIMSLKEAHPAGQRKRCSNRSKTDLSLRRRLPATRIILGIKVINVKIMFVECFKANSK